MNVERPLNAVGPQRAGHPHHVQKIPFATVFLPLPLVRIVKVAVVQTAHKLVVKTDRVKAEKDSAGCSDIVFEFAQKFGFG